MRMAKRIESLLSSWS